MKKIKKFPKTKTFSPKYPMMSVEDSREFINSLYSEPEVSSMVDPDNGGDDIMGCVLEFFDENDLDSDYTWS